LNINYRSTGHIISLANSFVKRNERILIDNPLLATREEGIKAQQIKQISLRLIIRQISYLMSRENLQLNDIIILYRNNYLSMRIEQELIYQRIPYEILGAFKFIEREEVKDVLAFLRATIYQDNLSLLRILKLSEGIGSKTLKKITYNSEAEKINIYTYLNNYSSLVDLEKDNISSKQKEKLTEFILKIAKLIEKSSEKGRLYDFVQEILNTFEYWEHLSKKNDSYERKKNIWQLLNVIES